MPYTVNLTIPDLDQANTREAARAFLAALISTDWSTGLAFDVDGETVLLTAEEVKSALSADDHS